MTELCLRDELYTFLCSPDTMKDKVSMRKNNLYLCIILFNVKFVVTLKFRCCLTNLCCSRSWM